MMDRMKLIGLAAIAVMSLLLFSQVQQEDSTSESTLILPGLKEQLAEVTKIEIAALAEDGESVTIEQVEGRWIVLQKAGYQADFESLSKLLSDLAALKIAERKTAKADNHKRLGLASSGENAGTLVSIDSGQTTELMVGKTAESRGSFVRLPDADQVYLTDVEIDLATDPMDYVDPIIINVDSADVQSVTISTAGSLLNAERSEETAEMTLLNLPVDAELQYATIADGLARMLINLRFLDVEPYDAERFSSPSRATINTRSGDTIQVATVKTDDGYWLHLDQESARTWQYQISEYTFKALNKTVADMLKSEEPDAD